MREQDTQLDGVFRTVGDLRRQADDMGRELEEQSGMLDMVDEWPTAWGAHWWAWRS